jgi:hypothetical protein
VPFGALKNIKNKDTDNVMILVDLLARITHHSIPTLRVCQSCRFLSFEYLHSTWGESTLKTVMRRAPSTRRAIMVIAQSRQIERKFTRLESSSALSRRSLYRSTSVLNH